MSMVNTAWPQPFSNIQKDGETKHTQYDTNVVVKEILYMKETQHIVPHLYLLCFIKFTFTFDTRPLDGYFASIYINCYVTSILDFIIL